MIYGPAMLHTNRICYTLKHTLLHTRERLQALFAQFLDLRRVHQTFCKLDLNHYWCEKMKRPLLNLLS